ncbi:tryptophan-tRNA ligase [Pseudovirgaria hyperparasitica]|uniref:tryptophan--tRNA ligase n=1 Tax=Pseudovirgaria hyperparasitica TaxID=470096 RepID=A0A6A6W0I0_9PEZI|nr:tryptophan-tRNA ligase [Pseudovirgaria hyperparasitica]KAF2756053.1 tryptophan-tRNA ligase [Pseudovirgaria hyperparasitica]
MSASLSRLATSSRWHLRVSYSCRHSSGVRSLSTHTTPKVIISKHIEGRKDPGITVFSGIQPTGIPHLGNYLGALRQWRDLQNSDTEVTPVFCIVDLHALTTVNPQEAAVLRQRKRETLASLLAAGLDPEKSIIYFQSSLQYHAELMWILSCNASMGYLTRMTQWKSKMELPDDAELTTSSPGKQLKLGLFSYPVLQAADILLHQADIVPVGADQRQHIEFTRELAKGFNNIYKDEKTYGDVFKLPKIHIPPTARIMSLTDPVEKMSKSHPKESSRIELTDSSDAIRRKLQKSVTDSIEGISYDPDVRPGISNLIDILYTLGHPDLGSSKGPEGLVPILSTLSKLELKRTVADAIDTELRPIREKYVNIMKEDKQDSGFLDNIAVTGMERAKKRAKSTMDVVRLALGYGH